MISDDATAVAPSPLPIGRNDPILQELWAIKAQINAEAGYDLDRLFEQARLLDENALIADVHRRAEESRATARASALGGDWP